MADILAHIEQEIENVLQPFLDAPLTAEAMDAIGQSLMSISQKYEYLDEELEEFVIVVSESLNFAILLPEEE